MKNIQFRSIIFFLFFFGINFSLFSQVSISAEEVKKHMGETTSVCGKIFSGNFLDKSTTRPTLLNMGAAYPNQLLTIMIPIEYRKNFTIKPEEYFLNKNVCVTGKIIDYKGKPEIIISSPSEILLETDFINRKPSQQTTTSGSTGTNDADTYVITISQAVNMRADPSLSASVVTVVKTGSKVSVYKSENGWSYVSVDVYNPTLEKYVVEYGYIKNTVLK